MKANLLGMQLSEITAFFEALSVHGVRRGHIKCALQYTQVALEMANHIKKVAGISTPEIEAKSIFSSLKSGNMMRVQNVLDIFKNPCIISTKDIQRCFEDVPYTQVVLRQAAPTNILFPCPNINLRDMVIMVPSFFGSTFSVNVEDEVYYHRMTPRFTLMLRGAVEESKGKCFTDQLRLIPDTHRLADLREVVLMFMLLAQGDPKRLKEVVRDNEISFTCDSATGEFPANNPITLTVKEDCLNIEHGWHGAPITMSVRPMV